MARDYENPIVPFTEYYNTNVSYVRTSIILRLRQIFLKKTLLLYHTIKHKICTYEYAIV